MTAELKAWEMLDSMSGSVSNEQEQGEVREVKRRYIIGPTEGFNDTVAKIEDYAPSYVNGDGAGIYWVRKRLDITGVGNKYFDCSATYQTLVPKQGGGGGGEPDQTQPIAGGIAWDTTGRTEHRTQAIATRKFGNNPPDFGGAINVSGDSVNGLDVYAPSMRYSETWILPATLALSCNYIGNVYRLTGTINALNFRCFHRCECLFLGARAQWQGDQPYVTVTYDFEARPSKVLKFTLNGVQFIELADGFDVLWFLYKSDVDQNVLVQKPYAAYIQRIYESDFWTPLLIPDLDIGVAPLQGVPLPGPAINGWAQ